jgi:hypothetical protein
MCLALKALIQFKPGASPQEFGLQLGVNAEGATHGIHVTRFQR